jgi:hypothetical protein
VDTISIDLFVFELGLAIVATVLYFVIERYVERGWWIFILGLIGLLAFFYPIFRHFYYTRPSISSWTYLLLLLATWALVGYDVYDRRRPVSRLVIHSAVYGAGPANDMDVAEILRRQTKDALAVQISNDLFGRDPAPNLPKRLRVEYSYGNPHVLTVERPEATRLVLPEDSWQQYQIQRFNAELREQRPLSLEIRPPQGEVLNAFVERAHGETHFRMEIYNSGSEIARNVQVRLVGIDPLPVSEYFRARADFPYFVRPAHLADSDVNGATDHDINAGTRQSFELLYYWESADHRIIVDGIDTKQARRDARFQIEERECWHLRYEVSSAGNGIQRPSFLLRREGTNLFMRRLV